MNEQELAERLVAAEQRSRANSHRLERLEKDQEAIKRIATSVAVMAEQQRSISDKVDTIDDKVSTLEGKSGRRWDSLVDKLVCAAAGAVLAWLAAGGP